MIILNGAIDLDKVPENKIFKGKNGGRYLNVSIIVNDTKDQYGNDASITIQQTKEERESDIKRIYIGNAKIGFKSEKPQTT